MKSVTRTAVCGLALLVILSNPVGTSADVVSASANGFEIRIVQHVAADTGKVSHALIHDLAKWWDGDHSWSGDAANMSMDLERRCLAEKLPDGGFVRHMEIVFYQPGKSLRLSGGLGPLQEMGVSGALTITISKAEGQTKIEITYNAHGASSLNLDQIAPAVDAVLSAQFKRLGDWCEKKVDSK